MKLLIEIILIISVFFVVKSYSQPDLVKDNLPYFESTIDEHGTLAEKFDIRLWPADE